MTRDYKDSHPCENQIIAAVTVVFAVAIIALIGIIGTINIEHRQEIAQIKSTCGSNHESI